MKYYLYIIECSNGAYYCGFTTNMIRRYREHVSGSKKCKYTRSFPPRSLAACWPIDTNLSQILKIEHAFKSLNRQKKTLLIQKPESFVEWIKQINE